MEKQLLDSYYTDLCADSVEWCPHDPFKLYFVCGLYQNDEKLSKNRHGQVLLFSFETGKLELKQQFETDAVLDQKWNKNTSILAIATAKNSIRLYTLDTHSYQLHELSHIQQINDDNVLILSLDWSKDDKIICSDSKGYVHLLKFSETNLTLLHSQKSHNFETWISAFDFSNSYLFYSGGDDAIIHIYDQRTIKKPIAKIQQHTYGVTTIQSNRKNEHKFVSGSYDEKIYQWDNRNVNEYITSKKMPDGIWRLKWDPFNCNKLLAACMSSGFFILEQNPDYQLNTKIHLNEHKSLAYGIDWCYHDDHNDIIATCSFYDKFMCVFQLK